MNSLEFHGGDAQILVGDVLDHLRSLPSNSVDCCVSSPPYYGLRDYGIDGQIGLEPSLKEFIAKLTEVFEEVRRVLKPSGTCWVNMGDSYASACFSYRMNSFGLKEKDLMGVPWRLAFALQDAGWYLRQDIIWAKPNPMPESIKDRCTKAHEYVFMLTKSARYAYDADAIKEPASMANYKMPDGWDTGAGGHGSYHREGREKGQKADKQRGHGRRHDGFNDRWDAMEKAEQCSGMANKRSVWSIATQPYAKAHFATFPEELPKLCILAGCPIGGTVLDPFSGSGTTIAVAVRYGRKAIGIELNPEYAELARERISAETPSLFQSAA